jgi:hypothetical protein
MIRTKQQRRRNRKLADKASPPPQATASVTTVLHGTNQVTVTFTAPVMISADNLPTTWLFGTANRTVESLVSATPTVVVLGLSGAVAATEAYTIGAFDPAVRTTTGGYIAGRTGVIA